MNLRIDRCGDTAKVSTYRNTRSATATSRLNCVFRAENHESAVTLPFGIPQIPETVAAHKPALKSPASPQKNHSKRHSPPDRSTPSDSPAGPPTENKSSADIPPSPPTSHIPPRQKFPCTAKIFPAPPHPAARPPARAIPAPEYLRNELSNFGNPPAHNSNIQKPAESTRSHPWCSSFPTPRSDSIPALRADRNPSINSAAAAPPRPHSRTSSANCTSNPLPAAAWSQIQAGSSPTGKPHPRFSAPRPRRLSADPDGTPPLATPHQSPTHIDAPRKNSFAAKRPRFRGPKSSALPARRIYPAGLSNLPSRRCP